MAEAPRIRIGNQTAFSAPTVLEPFEYALENGFDAFEWFPDRKISGAGWDENDLSPQLREQIRETASARNVRQSVHARWQANPLEAEGRQWLLKDIELAEDLGAAVLNIHFYPERGVAAYLEALWPLLGRLAGSGLHLVIENSPLNTPQEFNELFAALRAAAGGRAGRVGMCLDLGHANLCASTRNDYLRFLAELHPRIPIDHLHLHENWGDADSHLPLFTGPAARDEAGLKRFIERIRARRYRGSIILEQWPDPPSLLNRAREGLLRLFGETPADAR